MESSIERSGDRLSLFSPRMGFPDNTSDSTRSSKLLSDLPAAWVLPSDPRGGESAFGEDPNGEVYVFVLNGKTRRPEVGSRRPKRESGNLTANGTGGIGLFALRGKSTLSEAAWVNISFTVARTGGTALGGASGFFTIFDGAKSIKPGLGDRRPRLC